MPPSTLKVSKSAVDAGTTDPRTGQPSPYKWWKFTVTVRNTGQSPITEAQVFDTLPAELCAGVDDTTPPGAAPNPAVNLTPYFVNLNADEAPSAVNQGTNGSTQWQITWTNLSVGAPGSGFTLNPQEPGNLKQLESDYMRVFTFYAAIRGSTRTYQNLGTKFVVTNGNPSVLEQRQSGVAGDECPGQPGGSLYQPGWDVVSAGRERSHPARYRQHRGQNQLYAMGQTTQGTRAARNRCRCRRIRKRR